jgi:dimethylhistidine N-methyltransferase
VSFASDVRRGFGESPRRLPPHWFYDALGSALFEAITRLPWYRIASAEKGLLAAAREDLRALAGVTLLVEMGAGNGEKLDLVLAAVAEPARGLDVGLVDVSAAALASARRRAEAHPGVRVSCVEATYLEGLSRVTAARPPSGTALVLFLGSNLGNLDPDGARAFLEGVRSAVAPGDRLLLGADLVKPEKDLLLAYDDPVGVTAAFDKNVLLRMNRELGADFDLALWDHRAVWNAGESRVEMHLVSLSDQSVTIPASNVAVRFRTGETIFTEASHKYDPERLAGAVCAAGFAGSGRWTDGDARYALFLFEAV